MKEPSSGQNIEVTQHVGATPGSNKFKILFVFACIVVVSFFLISRAVLSPIPRFTSPSRVYINQLMSAGGLISEVTSKRRKLGYV